MAVSKNVRNVLIIAVIAALIVVVPGGGTAAGVVSVAVRLAFYAAIGWFASVMYREHRIALYSLGDAKRAVLYVAVGVAALTLTATSRLWPTGSGKIAELALLGGAAYAAFAVIWSARKY